MRPVRRETLPALVAEEIKRDIIHGHFKQGDKLPPENELREQLGVGRPTVREALRILEGQGWIKFKLSEGACVMDGSKISEMTSPYFQREEILELIDHELTQLNQEGKFIQETMKKDFERIKEDGTPSEIEIFYDNLRNIRNIDQRHDYPYVEPSNIEEIRESRNLERVPALKRPDSDFLYDRIYGAWLGRSIGCLLGKPVEGWTKNQIEDYLKLVDSYPLNDYFPYYPEKITNGELVFHPSAKEATKGNIQFMSRDDDMDYTILNLKLIQENGFNFTTEDVGEEWLLCFPYKQVYTAERQAYANLVRGLIPPSTAYYRNPFREWIGAQIRADVFGYVAPGDPELSALMAFNDARLSHVKNGIYGEMFVASAISAALVSHDIDEVIWSGLSQIPRKSRSYETITTVLSWCEKSSNWQEVWKKCTNSYGEYHWVHTLPNLAYVVLALVQGNLDFKKTISIAVMCGGDTDCNGATVGSILGAFLGAERIPKDMSKPLNDRIKSAVFGYSDSYISNLAQITFKIAKKILINKNIST